jgi:hypothetical protein
MSFELAGTYDDIPEDELLWAATRANSTNRWYPQDKPCARLDEKEFSCGEYFLGVQDESDKGGAFDIVLTRANTYAVNEFLRYDKEEKGQDPENLNPGLASLPTGAEIIARKPITRE